MTYEGYRVGPALRSLRKKKKISVFEASEMTGLSTNTINKIAQAQKLGA